MPLTQTIHRSIGSTDCPFSWQCGQLPALRQASTDRIGQSYDQGPLFVGGGRAGCQCGGRNSAGGWATGRLDGDWLWGARGWEGQGDGRDRRQQRKAPCRGRRPRDRSGGRPSGSRNNGIGGSIGQPRNIGFADRPNDGSGTARASVSRGVGWGRSSTRQALAPSTPGFGPGRNRWQAWRNAPGWCRQGVSKRTIPNREEGRVINGPTCDAASPVGSPGTRVRQAALRHGHGRSGPRSSA